jgi:hypothetical protein
VLRTNPLQAEQRVTTRNESVRLPFGALPPYPRHASAKVETELAAGTSGGREPVPQQNVGVMAGYRHRNGRGASRLRSATLALALTSSPASADTFQAKWMGRIAPPPARRSGSWFGVRGRIGSTVTPTALVYVERPVYTSLENAPS